MDITQFKNKVELMRDKIPYELYSELLNKEDLEACEKELSRYLHTHRVINPEIDRLYSYVHQSSSMYRSNLTENDRKKIKSYSGNRFTLS